MTSPFKSINLLSFILLSSHFLFGQSILSDVQLEKLEEGDILFQTSTSNQSKAIRLATHSDYSHCGVLIRNGKQLMVLEAVQPVKFTPVSTWIDRGEDDAFVVMRWKDADERMGEEEKQNMRTYARQQVGKNYDLYFQWSDKQMYCSELVWKLYKEVFDIEMGNIQALREFDLSHPVVQYKLKERFGAVIPMEEQVVSPQAIFESKLLYKVSLQ